MIPPSGSIKTGFVKPNSRILPAIWASDLGHLGLRMRPCIPRIRNKVLNLSILNSERSYSLVSCLRGSCARARKRVTLSVERWRAPRPQPIEAAVCQAWRKVERFAVGTGLAVAGIGAVGVGLAGAGVGAISTAGG